MADRRPLAWGDTIFNDVILDGAGLTPILNLLTELSPSDTVTVTRLIGYVTVVPQDSSLNVHCQQQVSLGIGVASREAFDAGVIPDPNSQSEQPARGWLYRDVRTLLYQNSATFGVEDFVYPTFVFDVRAARKVDRGVCFLEMVNNNIFGTSMIVRANGIVRALCQT